jgi:hypothetical protein
VDATEVGLRHGVCPYHAERYLLLSDSGLFDERFAKYLSLVAPLEAFFDDGSGLANHGASHHEPLVVEVGHCVDC